MNIAIIGYGKMGKSIEKIAINRGHNIISKTNNTNDLVNLSAEIDVAIEFSKPSCAFENISFCINHNIPVVSGTTGWLDKLNQVRELCNNQNATFIYSSNFSISMNIVLALNQITSKLIDYNIYNVHIEETHHITKKDSPSGTSISIAEAICANSTEFKTWTSKIKENNKILIKSKREKDNKGEHQIIYESKFDKITISHQAISREGFAEGAVIAAEYAKDKKGYYTMSDIIKTL